MNKLICALVKLVAALAVVSALLYAAVLYWDKIMAVAAKLKTSQGNRIISVKWDTHKLQSFEEVIEIRGIDRKGILIDILKVISDSYNVNMSRINIESNAGIFIGQFYIYVHDTDEIEHIRRDVLRIKEINTVVRIETPTP